MKLLLATILLGLCLVCLAFPPKTRAVLWVDELGECTDDYYHAAVALNEQFENNQITEQEWKNQHDAIGSTYRGCLSTVYPVQEPDFCAAAQSAEAHCDAQFGGLGLESWDEYYECRNKSGIDSCQ